MQKMDVKKTKKSYAHYEPDFKEEILRMLNSGKNVDEISRATALKFILFNTDYFIEKLRTSISFQSFMSYRHFGRLLFK